MTKQSRIAALFAASGLSVVLVASAALAQHQDHKMTRLGNVEFKVACTDAAQKDFNRAMALYHSFAWSDATAAFESVAKIDPACGMAHWGRAMTMFDNPFIWPANVPGPVLDKAAAALDEAKKAGLKTDRERAYVEATTAFVRDHAARDHRTRVKAFEEELGKVAAAYPDDKEAAILYGLVTSANFDPKDKTYANQRRAAQILEPLFAANPEHPGVAHYLIHTFDYPPIAKDGLTAAQRYAEIAPDAPHALHMPSHIFTRVGYWKESIASNRASAKADAGANFDTHHAFDYLVYAYLQLAHDANARAAMDESLSMKPIDHFGAAFAYAAMPARMTLERDDWAAASRIELKPGADAYPWQKYPQAEAINAFARGVGAARSGDATAAREQRKRLLALRDTSKVPYWADQIDIQAEILGALALCADGKQPECTEALRKVAAREDATEKHAVTPGPILPARELLGDTLLAQGKADEALTEYEAVLVKEPNRYRAIAGAMAASKQAGDNNKARSYAERLVKQAGGVAPGTRASLAQAQQMAAKP